MRGARLIYIDGMGGCGKTTSAHDLVEALAARGRRARVVREKSYAPFAEALRAWKAVRFAQDATDPDCTLLDEMVAARLAVHRDGFVAELAQCDTLILDRCWMTCAALRASTPEGTRRIIDKNLEHTDLRPNVAFVFVGSPQICRERDERRPDVSGIRAARLPMQLAELRRRYLQIAELVPGCYVIDGDLERANRITQMLDALEGR